MIPDLDIFRSAQALVKQHDPDALIHAAMRADAMLDKGDLDGYTVWKRIGRQSQRSTSAASLSALPVAGPSISAGAQHSLTGSPPTKKATKRNCFRRCATARPHNCGTLPLPLHPFLIGRIPEPIRHCGFLMATRTPL